MHAPAASDQDHHGVEALRGLAAMMVVVAHYVVLISPQGQGTWGLAATGVDLFFVLSGFVFARLLSRPGFSVGAHLLRRALRLYPLYIIALLTYALMRPTEGRWLAMPAHLAMLHTTGSLETASAYNVAFWSLPPEVEFYLLLPSLAALAAWLARRGWHALAPLLMAALVMKIGLVAMATPGESPESLRSVLTVHAPGLLIEFLLGSAVAVWGGHVHAPHLGAAWPGNLRRLAVGIGAAACLALWWVYDGQLSSPERASQASVWLAGNVGLWAALAFAALMLGLQPLGNRLQTSPWARLAAWAGRLSYGVYLFHNAAPGVIRGLWPEAQGWGLAASSLLLTLAVAALLHRLVEWPARAWGRRWAARLQPSAAREAGSLR
jgi:exopolysaccharide production protein ExoZ